MRRCVMELIEVFAKQGHSGFSAAFTLNMVTKLMDYKPLTPITNNPDEWVQVGEDMWQNLRSSDCFSYDAGKTYHSVSENNYWYVKWLYRLPLKVRKVVWKKYRFLVQRVHKSQEAKQLTTQS